MDLFTEKRAEYLLSTETQRMDVEFVHAYLSKESYWAEHIPMRTVQRSIEHSLNFGIFFRDKQVAFARVVSDYATFAYLGDVFVVEAHRKKGLSKWLMKSIMEHPELQGLRRWVLLTRDAHDLYRQFGWTPIAKPDRFMEKATPDIYRTAAENK